MLKLNVLSSTTIKHKKPFSKFTWLKEEDDYELYALQGYKLNHLVSSTGKVKKVEVLKQLCSRLVHVNHSLNGHYCAGVLDDGDVIIWSVDTKLPPLKISSPLSGGQLLSRGSIKIFVSNSSYHVLLVSAFSEFFLSRIEDDQHYAWWKVAIGCFPSLSDADKIEATVDAQFYHDMASGDCLSCTVAYSPSATPTIITVHHFTVQLFEESFSTDSFHVHHKILSYSSDDLSGCSSAPRGRGALVMRHSPSGKLIAMAVNYHKKSHSRIVFLSPQCNVMTTISPYGEGKDYGRAWWITDMAWTADGLLLVCIIKRGSLFILPCMGRPLELVTRGCSLDMGPATLLPLHPRISYIPAGTSRSNDLVDNEVSLSSERDTYKQKFSVGTHPVLPLILCSDGYLLTVLSLGETYSLIGLVISLVKVSKAKFSHYNQMRENKDTIKKEKKRRQSLSSISLHGNHQNAFSDISNFPDLDQTVQSRLHSTSKYSVHFAGIDDVHETSLHDDGDPVSHIFSHATSAFCLLLNSETLLPHSGMFPYSGIIDNAKVDCAHSDMVRAGNLVISVLLGIDGPLDLTSGNLKSFFSMSHLAPVVLKLFELMPLDTNCSHYGLYSKLTSVFLQLYFTELHHGFDHWSAVLKYNYSDKVNFIENYCHTISTTASLLHYIIECVNHTYDMSCCVCGDEMSAVTSFASVSFLIPSFQFLVKDVYFFINLLKNLFAQNQSNVMDHVKKSIRTSLEVLKFTQHWLTCLTGGTKLPTKKLNPGIDQYMQGNQRKASQIFEQCYSELRTQISTTEPFHLFTAGSTVDSELTGLCLCILCHKLSQYNINEAIRFAHSFIFNIQTEELSSSISLDEAKRTLHFSEDSDYSDVCINSHCGLVIIQCLAKLMCCYFTNRPLHIPSLSSIGCAASDKHIELDRSKLAKAITKQDLQSLWCPEHALKLLLLSGLWEEAIQFPLQLGDWKKAFLLSVTFQETQDCRTVCFHTNTSQDFLFNILFTHITNLLQHYKGVTPILPEESHTSRNRRSSSVISMTHSEKGSPRGDLVVDINSLLHIAAVCDLDRVLLQLCYCCLDDLTNAVQQLDVFVPHGVHLPSPPLYCPQPSVDQSVMMLNPMEWSLRQVMYEKVQQLLFLLRASHSLVPCIKCYALGISSLTEFIQEGDECFNNIPTRSGCVTNVSVSTIMQSITNRAEIGFDIFQSDSGDSGCPHTAKVLLAIFRQLCVLLWYLHVRENATLHFRKLQSLANGCQEYDPSIADDSIAWCARLMPFVKFKEKDEAKENNIENSVLSLLLELPMDSHFVCLFAHCFPQGAESFMERSDKWKSLMSRVKLKLNLYNAEHDEVKSPAELYVEKSKVRLEQLNSNTFQISPFENTVSQITVESDSSLELTANALYVGSWEFEYDIIYVEFLDTLISILSPIEETASKLNYSVTSLSKDHTPSYRPPLIGAYYSHRIHSNPHHSGNAMWNSMTTFVEQIHRWAHLSSTLPSTPSELPSMRVGVHLKFLINCLQLYSRPAGSNGQCTIEHHHDTTPTTNEVTQSIDGGRRSPDVRPAGSNGQCTIEHHHDTTPTTTEVIQSVDGGRRSPDDVPDFHEDKSSAAISPQSAGSQELLVEHLTAKESSRSVEIADHSKESAISPTKLLLQLPQGTLQGQLSQYAVRSLHKSVSSFLHDSSHISINQSISRHHTGRIVSEEFSIGECIASTCSDNVFSEITMTDDLSSTTGNTLSLSPGEVIPPISKQEFTCQQETNSAHNHSAVMISEVHDEVDGKVANDDSKVATDVDKTTTSIDSSSSDNTTLIAEDNTGIVQVQPMQSPPVSNSDTQPHPIITSSKENDIVMSVSDQSTLSQSSEEISENITHSITQPKVIAESVVMKQSEKQSDHMISTSSQHDTVTTALSQHDDNVSASNGGYMEKDSLCSSQSTITSSSQDNMMISRSQLRKVLKSELRKLLPPPQNDRKSKPDRTEVSVQYETPSSDSVKSTSTVKDQSSSPIEAVVEKHVYPDMSSSENTPSLLEVKDLEESSDGLAADKTHITVVVSDDMLCHYNARRTPSVDKSQKRKSKTHKKVKRRSKIVDETLSDNTASKTLSGINSSQSATSIDIAQDADSKDVQEQNMLSNQRIKNFPLLQLTSTNAVKQDDMKREFPGLVKSLQIFDNAATHRNKPFVSPVTQQPAPKTEYSTVPPHSHVPPYFKAMPFSAKPTMSHDPSNKVQRHRNMPQLFPHAFPLLNVTKDVAPTNHQPEFKFPLIPFKPFVPKLIKPNDLTGHGKSKPFPLLHCEHPSYQQARQGHPLLKLPEKEIWIENSKVSQPIPLSKLHDVSSHSSSSSIPCGKLDSVPSSTTSMKTKRHRKSQKSKPSNKPHFVESSVQTDVSYRVPSPVTASVESSRDTKSAEKLVQTSPPQTPKDKTIMASLPVFIEHQGLEMKRMEMQQSQKVTPTTAASVLRQTIALDSINDSNIQVSDTIPSTADSDTVNSGSRVKVTHTRVTPEHHASTVITDQDDQSSYKHASTVVTDQGDQSSCKHTSTVITDQDDQSSCKHTSTVVTDQGDQLSTEHIDTANDDQEVASSSSHKQSFLNVMDIEGELVVNDDHKETTSISSTSGQSSVQGIALLREHNTQSVTEENRNINCHSTTTHTGGAHSAMLTKLQEMDAQLTAIENTAKKVEGEFHDSNQLLDTINQLQQIKALHTAQVRKSAPITSAEPLAPQVAAVVTETLNKPSANPSFTPDQFPSLQSTSNVRLSDELVHTTSGSSDDNVMSKFDPTGTLVEMNVEQVSNVMPSTADINKGHNPVTRHYANGSISELLPEVHKHKTKRRLSSTRQDLASTVTLNQSQRRKQEKSNNEKRLRDAFSLMNDILTSKPSLHHKPSYNTANHDGSVDHKHRQRRRYNKVDTRTCDSMDSSIASGSIDWDAVDQILNS